MPYLIRTTYRIRKEGREPFPAVSLHYHAYNLARVDQTLKSVPAMAGRWSTEVVFKKSPHSSNKLTHYPWPPLKDRSARAAAEIGYLATCGEE
ncbi:MAG: hypothetical protein LC808_43250 [Actinobacteria bacterium]|nr:hypothetical protein [Actinomycetota bacterium]